MGRFPAFIVSPRGAGGGTAAFLENFGGSGRCRQVAPGGPSPLRQQNVFSGGRSLPQFTRFTGLTPTPALPLAYPTSCKVIPRTGRCLWHRPRAPSGGESRSDAFLGRGNFPDSLWGRSDFGPRDQGVSRCRRSPCELMKKYPALSFWRKILWPGLEVTECPPPTELLHELCELLCVSLVREPPMRLSVSTSGSWGREEDPGGAGKRALDI